MDFNFKIPKSENEILDFTIGPGKCLFVLGANGVGKSSLMNYFKRIYPKHARAISAHRQNWLPTNTINISPQDKVNYENGMHNSDQNLHARFRDDYSTQRPIIAIYDLIDSHNLRAREIAEYADKKDFARVAELVEQVAPVTKINEILKSANLPISISLRKNSELMALRKGAQEYSIAELSDGERNALLVAAQILTVPPGTLLLIDEPERHLHKSIVAPLLLQFIAERKDCAFIVSTHDVSLPAEYFDPNMSVFLVRDCTYKSSTNIWWNIDIVTTQLDIDERIKTDVYGSRRKLLFVEGNIRSLDKGLYSILLPNVSVVPKSGCRDVDQATVGVRASKDLHWIHAFGLIDNDRRSVSEIELLRKKGVYTLNVYSVESIYYHPEMQKIAVERLCAATGEDINKKIIEAGKAAISSLESQVVTLSHRAVERFLREQLFHQLPKARDFARIPKIEISFDHVAKINEEMVELKNLIQKEDFASLLARYPLRETSALSEIVRKLGFQDREQYEGTVRKILLDNPVALATARTMLGDLFEVIGND